MNAAKRGAFLEDPPEGAPDIEEVHHVSDQSEKFLIGKSVTDANQIARLLVPLNQIQIHSLQSGIAPCLCATKRQDFP